jgi:hypothetical protein
MCINCGKNIAELIAEEGLDEDGNPIKCHTSSQSKSKQKLKQHKSTATIGDDADEDKDDGDFSASDSGQSHSSSRLGDSSDVEMLSNNKVCTLWLSVSTSI